MAKVNKLNSTEDQTQDIKSRTTFIPEDRRNWMLQKEKLRKKFDLTYAELAFEEGKKDEMLARLESKLDLSKEQLRAIIAAL